MTPPTACQSDGAALSARELLHRLHGRFAQLELVGAEGLEPPTCWL
jgi:hypothetical protein